MPYPEEIIVEIATKYYLSEALQQQLRNSLLIEELRPLVEAGGFNPEDLLIQLKFSGELYILVLSPIAVRQIVADPAKLTNLRIAALANPEAFREWDRIKFEIQAIHDLPPTQRRLKQTRTQELYPRMFAFLTMYAAIIATNSIFQEESFNLSASLSQYLNILIEPIKEAAEKYFRSLFEKMDRNITEIIFPPKSGGIQLGTKMIITYMEPEKASGVTAEKPIIHRIRYHIKTHQHGSASQASSTKPVDPKELFVYKVLEYIGYGPKAHFFFNPLSVGGFFIATQDIAFTKIIDKKKSFIFFDNIKEKYNAMPNAPEHDEARRALICLDILSRILRLHDTTTNPDNFGQAIVEPEIHKWKFLDFRIASDAEFYFNPQIFEGFQEGNGVFNYDYADFLKHTFRDPAYEKRKMEMASQIMTELHEGRLCQSRRNRKMSLAAAMEQAYKEIQCYITESQTALRIDLDAALTDFEKYFKAIRQNLTLLAEGIQIRHAELSAEPAKSLLDT